MLVLSYKTIFAIGQDRSSRLRVVLIYKVPEHLRYPVLNTVLPSPIKDMYTKISESALTTAYISPLAPLFIWPPGLQDSGVKCRSGGGGRRKNSKPRLSLVR